MRTMIVVLLALAAGIGVGAWLDGRRVEAQSRLQAPPTMDVPAKEWDAIEPSGLMEPIVCDPPVPANSSVGCFKPAMVKVHHGPLCEDESRFLLQSGDGAWRCLALSPRP